MDLRVDGERLKSRIEALYEYGRQREGGCTRLAYTEEERKARQAVIEMMKKAGLEIRIDSVGNIFGRRAGKNNKLPVVASGSHIDTVPGGGKFDGVLGVMAAVEALETIIEHDIVTEHPLEVIIFVNEEGARFSEGLLGSRCMVGEITLEQLRACKDDRGITLEKAMHDFGFPGDPEQARVEPGYYRAYFELHIEQGCVLENAGIPIGIVEGIAGLYWFEATVKGRADHAGTTPMEFRRDALLTASKIILETERVALKAGGSCVATVGRLFVRPNAINIIPGEVTLTFDIRDVDVKRRDRVADYIQKFIEKLAENCELDCCIKDLQKVDPKFTSKKIREAIIKQCCKLELPYMLMNSGASHDAQVMTALTDVGLIFIPSEGGRSHCPEEFSRWEHVERGANVLLHSILEVAGYA